MNIFGDATTTGVDESLETQEVVEDEDGNQVLVIKDKSGKVTEMRKVTVQKIETIDAVDSTGNYLLITGIVVVTFVVLLSVICLVKRCRKKEEREPIAEFVLSERNKNKFADAEFDNVATILAERYAPRGSQAENVFVMEAGKDAESAPDAPAESA